MGTFVCGVLCRIIAILITYGIDAITSPIDPSSYAPTPTNNPIATSNSTTVNLSSTYIPSQSNPTTKPTVYHSLDVYYCFSTYSDRYSSFNASLCGRNIELERELFYNDTITQGINFKNYYTIPTKLKLFVGDLLQKHTSKDLYDLFIKYGTIRESVVIPDRFRVRSRCYGFITFELEQSVCKALKNSPITTLEGIKLTVILAAENTKPRQAHFNVKHGISGHKPLPNVYEKENENKNKNETKKYIIQKTKINSKESIRIYTDPSLFRTANIQQIAPAKFEIENENTNENVNENNWPNEDIKKDFKYLKKLKVFNDSKCKNKKHLKSISKKRNEPNNNSDDICSMKSREWTPIDRKNKSNEIQGESDHQIEKEIELVSEGKLSCNSLAFEEFGNENNRKQISFSDNFRNNYAIGKGERIKYDMMNNQKKI